MVKVTGQVHLPTAACLQIWECVTKHLPHHLQEAVVLMQSALLDSLTENMATQSGCTCGVVWPEASQNSQAAVEGACIALVHVLQHAI